VLRERAFHESREDRDQSKMMNGVGDGVDQFTADRRLGGSGVALHVAYGASNPYRRIEELERNSFKVAPQPLSQLEGDLRYRLNAFVTFPMIIVHFTCFNAVQKTRKVIETMSVVSTNGSVEGNGNPA